ncbi:MAG: SDR family NAD(P)-dependent oxidoreductase [Pseudomonadota bacterium]
MKAADLAKILGFYGRFTPTYSRIGYLARRPGWSRDSRDFSGQHWLVTGASGGIGAAIVAGAAAGGATVTAVARSMDKLEEMRSRLPGEAAERLSLRGCDLARVAAIDGLLAELSADAATLDVLVNNVGVLLNDLTLTDEGFETSYVTNLLGHFQLTEGLLDAKGLHAKGLHAKGLDKKGTTAAPLILNMASGGLYNVPLGTPFLNVTDAKRYSGKLAYAAHKRGQVELSERWDTRLSEQGGQSYVLHPGWVRTEGVRSALPVFYRLQGALLRTPAEGADTALWLAATRPSEAGREIWFDRAVRPQHVFPHTRTPTCTPQDLFAFLERDLAAARA